MQTKESLLDNLFQEFISSFEKATPEEKQRLAGQLFSKIEQKVGLTGNHAPTNIIEPDSRDSDFSKKAASGMFQSEKDRDFTEQNIQDLVEKEIHLKQIADNVEQVVWLSDIHSSRILYVSPSFEVVWGRSGKSLVTDPMILIESIHPEDRVQVMVANPRYVHKPFNQVYRILRPDGSLRWIFARVFVIRDEIGNPFYLCCIAQDITEQKQVEMILRKTLDRTREQFDLSHKMSLARKPQAVLKTLMSAAELRSAQRAAFLFFENPIIGAAHGVEVIYNWQSNQVHSDWSSESALYEEPAFWELFHPNRTVMITEVRNHPRLTPSVQRFLLEGQIKTLVLFPLIASGNWLGCLVVYFQEENNFEHNELRYLKVLVDQATITLYNLHLLEVEEESRHEAERANAIKTEFLAMISHELRTPLTSIIGFTTTMLADDVTWEPNEQRDFITTIMQEGNRLEELIDHLLDLSRLEAGILPILQEIHSLDEIINDALPQLNILTSGHKLTMHIPAKLPPLFVDAKRIAQVLVNLVRNASTYAPKGTEIEIGAIVRESNMQINVSDQGPGIPPAEHKSVFKAFKRGTNVGNSMVQGAGLGLAICKGLIEAHGGRIWVKKKTTPGTTMSFTIPLTPIQITLEHIKNEE